jgi:anthranilate/para-aminobenzoate synthase component I
VLFFADRLIVLDHHERQAYALAVHRDSAAESAAAAAWLRRACRCLELPQERKHGMCASSAAAPARSHSSHQQASGSLPHHRQAACKSHALDSKRAQAHTAHAAPAHAPTPYTAVAMPVAGQRHDRQRSRRSSSGAAEVAEGHAAEHGTMHRLQPQLLSTLSPASSLSTANGSSGAPSRRFVMHRSRAQYLRDIQACKDALFRGDSYEICLTNALVAPAAGIEPWGLYRTLRRVNAAPYAAWLHCGQVRRVELACRHRLICMSTLHAV